MSFKNFCTWVLIILISTFSLKSIAFERGIYITQPTLENTRKITYLLQQSQKTHINTFVVDMQRPSRRFAKNIVLLKKYHIRYVARIIVFPYGGTYKQIRSPAYWQKKFKLVNLALHYGAQEIQLDYIRYRVSTKGSNQNSKDIYAVIKWFKQQLNKRRIPLQIAIFGEAAYGTSRHIGQDVLLFADAVDVVCPMLYPSHFEPFRKHARTPYQTVYNSIIALRNQFHGKPPFKIYTYIELYNYRFPLSRQQKTKYIYAQIRAVHDAGAQGWYAWSANNHYGNLFYVLRMHPGA